MSLIPFKNQSLYESLFKHTHCIMLMIDPDNGRILDANPAALSFYGYSEKEMQSMKISDINILSEKDIRKEIRNARFNHRNHFNFRHRLKNGDIRDVEVYSSPISFENGQILFSVIHDVSDKKLALENLQKNESTIRGMLNATGSLVYLFDTRLTIINLNIPGALLFDKSPEEMIGQNFRLFFSKDEFSNLEELVREVIENQNPISYRKEKKGRCFDVNLYPVFNEQDQVDRICVFANDITELKKTEKLLAAVETTGAVCHEMNQPLQVILGNLELLRLSLKEDDPKIAMIDTILAHVDRLGRITKKLTHITRYETKDYVKGTIFDIDKSSGEI